tara:strand:+ start:479 stop:829 length:351 start_codon:yes stop_codon:yes gene_type:complete
MNELTGRNAKRMKNSKAMECAARYLVEQDRWMTADEIYHNMTYLNGNLYRNTRHTMHFTSFAARLMRLRGIEKRSKHPMEYKMNKTTYDLLFPIDPMMRRKQGGERNRDKNMRFSV